MAIKEYHWAKLQLSRASLIISYCNLTKGINPQKNLLLFGHCQNCLDSWTPGFLDTYEELLPKSAFFLKVSGTIWIWVRPPTPLDGAQSEGDI